MKLSFLKHIGFTTIWSVSMCVFINFIFLSLSIASFVEGFYTIGFGMLAMSLFIGGFSAYGLHQHLSLLWFEYRQKEARKVASSVHSHRK